MAILHYIVDIEVDTDLTKDGETWRHINEAIGNVQGVTDVDMMDVQ